MKRFFQYLLMVISVCGMTLVIMPGCNPNSKATITIQDPGDEIFPLDDYFKVEKTVNVSAEGKGALLSPITDFYITDTYAFILDSNNRIFKVDLNTGQVVKLLFAGKRLSCITGDDQYLYCLNISDNKYVCKYDFDLELQQEINIHLIRATSSFIKADQGFMFYNTRQTNKVGRFVVTDNECLKASSFLISTDVPRKSQVGVPTTVLYPHYLFVPYKRGKTLFFDPEYNIAYLYNGHNVQKLFGINNDEALSDSRSPYINQLFFLNGNILVKYSCNRKRCYAYLDKKFNVISQGMVYPSVDKNQMSLITQYGSKRLVKIFLTDIGLGDVVPGRSIQAQIIFYRVK